MKGRKTDCNYPESNNLIRLVILRHYSFPLNNRCSPLQVLRLNFLIIDSEGLARTCNLST
jgi:hypothetical protein